MAYSLVIDKTFETTYSGKAEICTYTFKSLPEQLPFEQWFAQRFIDSHIRELANQGSHALKLKVWRDTSPTFTTDYKVEVTASASPLWWNIIIVGAIAVIGLALITWAIIEVKGIDWGEIPEELKKAIGWMPILLGLGLLVWATRK